MENRDFIIENGVLTKYTGTESTVVVPDGVRVISCGAFLYRKEPMEVVLPQGVTRIDEDAFFSCHGLTRINLPDSVTEIGDRAFLYCDALEHITLPEGLKRIGVRAFARCAKLEEIVLPCGLTCVKERAFDHCYGLKRVVFSAAVPELETNLFAKCVMLEEVVMPDDFACTLGEKGVKDILGTSFNVFVWSILERDRLNGVIEELAARVAAEEDERTHWAERAIEAGDVARLSRLLELCETVYPDELDEWLELASREGQHECSLVLLQNKRLRYTEAQLEQMEEEKIEKELGLRERTLRDWKKIFEITASEAGLEIEGIRDPMPRVTVPARIGDRPVTQFRLSDRKLREVWIEEGIERISDQAFRCCYGLEFVSLPESLTGIGLRGFDECTELKEITLPDNLTEIGSHAFRSCRNLLAVDVPDGVKVISESAFQNCVSMERLTLHEGLKKIGDQAFYGCLELREVVIPEGVAAIGARAFESCMALKDVTLPASVTEIGAYAFYFCGQITLHAPKDSFAERYATENGIRFMAVT